MSRQAHVFSLCQPVLRTPTPRNLSIGRDYRGDDVSDFNGGLRPAISVRFPLESIDSYSYRRVRESFDQRLFDGKNGVVGWDLRGMQLLPRSGTSGRENYKAQEEYARFHSTNYSCHLRSGFFTWQLVIALSITWEALVLFTGFCRSWDRSPGFLQVAV
ncbi:uncharacterized protein H6S33_013106 [Morchella sextelata]|uniref:uncharacterized protein n=1 Tax=Morchella sextelata TaxID=1174677 RepID=UPI001D04511A|nr:uncharacterized protein H6S33_013106 [Morchella sextelata]KAH0609620.1 hypothetical protein H6S33_013106 [Morchella sextelata]